MREKKEKTFGGVEVRYASDLESLQFEALDLSMSTMAIVEELRRDDSEMGEIQAAWLNGPFAILQKLEADAAALEKKVLEDTGFSERHRRGFVDEYVEPVKADCLNARDVDSFVMSHVPMPAW